MILLRRTDLLCIDRWVNASQETACRLEDWQLHYKGKPIYSKGVKALLSLLEDAEERGQ